MSGPTGTARVSRRKAALAPVARRKLALRHGGRAPGLEERIGGATGAAAPIASAASVAAHAAVATGAHFPGTNDAAQPSGTTHASQTAVGSDSAVSSVAAGELCRLQDRPRGIHQKHAERAAACASSPAAAATTATGATTATAIARAGNREGASLSTTTSSSATSVAGLSLPTEITDHALPKIKEYQASPTTLSVDSILPARSVKAVATHEARLSA